ncbi:hypothetical protein LPE509_02826 [Legionella pneumophila subsp. pneumophila LPE509]|nr:hypothetical protein LPE509_02826 [Legionella pneumophila subsp. pneumophila LPE509]
METGRFNTNRYLGCTENPISSKQQISYGNLLIALLISS